MGYYRPSCSLIGLLLFYITITSCQVIWQCNFDSGSTTPCGMTQSNTDTSGYEWLPLNQSTPSANTGPTVDHTTGSGYFMYLEASERAVGDFADLDSPVFNSGSYCLKFWYHMYGQHIGSLRVSTVTNSDSYQVWNKERVGANGVDEWIQAEANITVDAAISNTWQLRFRGTRGGDTNGQPFGDIGIDDVRLESCSAQASTTTTTTTTTRPPTTSTTSATTTTKLTQPTTKSTTRSTTKIIATQSTSKETSNTDSTQTSIEGSTNESTSISSTDTTKNPPTTNGATPTASGLTEELWGLEARYWIIILSVAGFVILVLLLVIICQACALSHAKTTTAHITRRTGDFDNFDGYTKYSGAGNGSAGNGTSSAPGYINAYENGAYTNDP